MIPQITINILLSAMVYILIGLSFSIVYHITKMFHFAHAIIITFGAYCSYLFLQQLSLPQFIAFPFSVAISTVIGVSIELLILRPLRKNRITSWYLLLVSLGLYVILQNVISLLWGDNLRNIRSVAVTSGHEFYGAYVTNIQINSIIVCVLLFIITLVFLKLSNIGKSLRGVASNLPLCDIYGINSNYIITLSFIIGSALAATTGILMAFDTSMNPTMGFHVFLYGVVAMIIGGVGNIRGLIGGVLLLASTQHLAVLFIDSKWMDAVAFIILILFLIWKPLGFSGKRLKKVEI